MAKRRAGSDPGELARQGLALIGDLARARGQDPAEAIRGLVGWTEHVTELLRKELAVVGPEVDP